MVEEIKKDLESLLSEYRYNHCLRVGETAKDLAKHYNLNEEEAYLAGLTHDIAKEFTMEENEQFIKEHNLDEHGYSLDGNIERPSGGRTPGGDAWENRFGKYEDE